jgi:hypothetical protein
MKLFRVLAHDPRAATGRPGHPTYVYPGQTAGRWDNASAYTIWYTSRTAAGAVGEAFGDLASWSPDMFATPYLPSARRALAIFEMPSGTALLDLDDPEELSARGLRPSQVVERHPAFTQAFALGVFRETTADGARRWAGLSWWSFHRPHWTNVALWSAPGEACPLSLTAVEPLALSHPAVAEAAATLSRPLAMS